MATDDPRTRRKPAHVQAWRQVLNENWPDNPGGYRNREPDIPVRARVVFEEDGECWLDGKAKRWDAEHVYVFIDPYDKRINGNGVWLKPQDVYRSQGQLPPK